MPGPISKMMGELGQHGSVGSAIGAAGPLLNQKVSTAVGGGAKAGAGQFSSMGRKPPKGGFGGGQFSSMGKEPPKGGFGGGSGLGGMKPTDTHKAAYMAVLTAAMQKAHQSQFFNLETAINDLNVKLSNLRGSQAHLDSLGQAIGQNAMLSNELQNMMKNMGSVLNDAARHFK